MSKTADQLVEEADKLDDEKRHPEAVKVLDEALALDPKHGHGHFLKGFVLEQMGDGTNKEEVIALYRKALEYGYTQGCCYENMANQLMMSGYAEEATKNFLNAFEADNSRTNALSMSGYLHEFLGNKEEAMKCYERALAQNSNTFKANYYKGLLLSESGKYTEAIEHYQKALTQNSNHPGCWYHQGKAYLALENKDEAENCFSKILDYTPKNSIEFCNRGQCLLMLEKKEEAMKDFKRCQEILATDKKTILSPQYIDYMKAVLKSVFEAEEASSKVEAAVSNLDQTNPAIQKFILSLKKLQAQKDQAQTNVLKNAGQATAEVTNNKDLTELNNITEEFRKKLEQVEQELANVKNDVKRVETKVQALEKNMLELKEELDNKMDDFNKKLDSALEKQEDLSQDDRQKLRGYFRAFVGTFSSIHVTCQVVDSGQVKLDTDNNAGTILSFIASFVPFIGSNLSNGISTINELLQTQEMIKNARRIKGLAPDAVTLSQLIGKSGYEIVLDKTKQQEIIKVTDKDLRQMSGELFEKILNICENLNTSLDAYLYTALYPTPAERAGHNDANILINKWLTGMIAPYEIQEQLVSEILKEKPTEPISARTVVEVDKDAKPAEGCCNMF